jgi:SepF-like predicted cell division protein (DUF552 family)
VPNPAAVKVHLILPRSFNDAQQIADRFKDGVPVILNLQSADQDLSKRLIDFASGLTYALDGGMQRVADKVFLLTPRNVEVSAEERARMLERGGFFNQPSDSGTAALQPAAVPLYCSTGLRTASARQEPRGGRVGKPRRRRTKQHGRPSRLVRLARRRGSSLASFVEVSSSSTSCCCSRTSSRPGFGSRTTRG